jgi:hypothetical protein
MSVMLLHVCRSLAQSYWDNLKQVTCSSTLRGSNFARLAAIDVARNGDAILEPSWMRPIACRTDQQQIAAFVLVDRHGEVCLAVFAVMNVAVIAHRAFQVLLAVATRESFGVFAYFPAWRAFPLVAFLNVKLIAPSILAAAGALDLVALVIEIATV